MPDKQKKKKALPKKYTKNKKQPQLWFEPKMLPAVNVCTMVNADAHFQVFQWV